jgi:hypothetical protein
LNSLGYVEMYSDAGSGEAAKSALYYFGNAADGTVGNYGNAQGIFGDGSADGIVQRQFWLGAGDYTVFLGGANITGTNTGNQSASLSLSVIPEPSSIILTGCAVLGFAMRRRRA